MFWHKSDSSKWVAGAIAAAVASFATPYSAMALNPGDPCDTASDTCKCTTGGFFQLYKTTCITVASDTPNICKLADKKIAWMKKYSIVGNVLGVDGQPLVGQRSNPQGHNMLDIIQGLNVADPSDNAKANALLLPPVAFGLDQQPITQTDNRTKLLEEFRESKKKIDGLIKDIAGSADKTCSDCFAIRDWTILKAAVRYASPLRVAGSTKSEAEWQELLNKPEGGVESVRLNEITDEAGSMHLT